MSKYSRRDWFRLKPTTSDLLGNDGSPKMKAVDQPPNYDRRDLSTLPPVREAWLSAEQVQALFHDIHKQGRDVQLMMRSQSGDNQAQMLDAAGARFLSQEVSKLQIRYCWENAKWIDTLEHHPDGIRLVRIKHNT